MVRGRAIYFHKMSTFCIYLRNILRTISSPQRIIHFDYQHRRDKMNNERKIARASQAGWVEVVLALVAHGWVGTGEESSRFVCPGV
jgi:hypothetical protein